MVDFIEFLKNRHWRK